MANECRMNDYRVCGCPGCRMDAYLKCGCSKCREKAMDAIVAKEGPLVVHLLATLESLLDMDCLSDAMALYIRKSIEPRRLWGILDDQDF